jgi:hypothetical protein
MLVGVAGVAAPPFWSCGLSPAADILRPFAERWRCRQGPWLVPHD